MTGSGYVIEGGSWPNAIGGSHRPPAHRGLPLVALKNTVAFRSGLLGREPWNAALPRYRRLTLPHVWVGAIRKGPIVRISHTLNRVS